MARQTVLDKAIAEIDADIKNLTKAREILLAVKVTTERKVKKARKAKAPVPA